MATLTNRNINETYFGLLKTNDNGSINGLTRVTDGLGCNSSISINCGDGSSNALCVHGNLTFDTLCNFNFPQAGSSTNEVFIVNNCNVTLGNANDILQDQFTFSGGLSSFTSPFDITLNDKGIVTQVSNSSKTNRPKYILLTGGTTGLKQTSNGSYTYNIADFTGSGLITDDISMIYVQVYTRRPAGAGTAQINAVFPNGQGNVLSRSQTFDGNDEVNSQTTVGIPINEDTTSIRLDISGTGSKEFILRGATVYQS